MNAELAEKIVAEILMNPERLDMGSFFHGPLDTIGDIRRAWPCGTTACIAGHAVIMTADDGLRLMNTVVMPSGFANATKPDLVLIEHLAIKALDIKPDVADWLFYHVTDSEAVLALKFLIGQPDATGREFREFILAGRATPGSEDNAE